ncbi:MAG: hypothetical protein ACLFQV_00585 [Vulcanimicrobiota bacterium]
MSFNPLEEKGIPLEKQTRNWEQLCVEPYNNEEVHPYTRTRIILMNGIEFEANWFGHQFSRHCSNLELKRELAQTRRLEQQQQKVINWLIPANENVLEVTLGFEQVAVDLTAWLAQNEPDEEVKKALDFALLEDFDHLYRYANLMALTQGKKGEKIVEKLTEITPGRPTYEEHRNPKDDIRKPIDNKKADIQTKLNLLTIVAGEQQTMNFYNNVGNRPEERLGRGLYQEIAMVEEEHVTHYESLMDPSATWAERLLLHEYNECYLYYSMYSYETDKRIKDIWELHLNMELGHLHKAIELMKKYDNRDGRNLLPRELPEPMEFKSNIDYVRKVLRNTIDYTTYGTEYINKVDLPRDNRFYSYQKSVNQGGFLPSIDVIKSMADQKGKDYRSEVKGPNPVKRLQQQEMIPA